MPEIIITPSINNRNTIDKIKEFLGWNHEEYSISTSVENETSPARPPRRKKTSRNSVGPSANADTKTLASSTPMHANDVVNEVELKHNGVENHI
jgi:hypothetical protein